MATNEPTIWTIGHSTHELDHFISLLQQVPIETLADVRLLPGSRRHPQFGQENLAEGLRAAGIEYRHFPNLGGRRNRRAAGSPNNAWRVEAFNAYADHMQTSVFRTALAELEELARSQRTAIMCAEAVPWRCHRRLIADALIANEWAVLDIFAAGRIKEHALTEFARVQNGEVTYPEIFDQPE